MYIIAEESSMKKTADYILEQANNLESEIKTFLSIIENISTVWSGDDAQRYINVLKEKYIPGMIQLKEILVNYGVYLKTASECYTLLDENFANKKINI